MKKKVAIIGYGGMGAMHAKHALKSDVVELAGIWDINPERRVTATENGIFVYSSLEAVLSDSAVDIITVATPNDTHMELSIAALEAGKNVICEKPVALNHGQLECMLEASKRTGRLFTVHQNRRYDRDFLMMKDVYHSGELGEVFGVESRIQGSRGIPGDWRKEKQHGGGMMLDWGVHLIDEMLLIVDDRKINSIYCRFDHITNNEVDDGFKLDLYFENELNVRIEVGTSHFASMPRYFMTGKRGSAIINNLTGNCHVFLCEKWDEENVVPVVTGAGPTRTMAPRDKKTVLEHEISKPTPDAHDFYRNFCLAIDGKAQQFVTHRQIRRVMQIMEAAFESDSLALPVNFEDIYFN